MSILLTHLTHTKRLLSDARKYNIPATAIIKHVAQIERLIKRASCLHNPIPKPFKTVRSTGIIWKCEKCNKITGIETNP